MMGAAGSAQAAGLKTELANLLCMVTGSSSITLFAGGAALVAFLVMFTLGEGKEALSTLLKIAIGISCLIFLPGIIVTIFPALAGTSCFVAGGVGTGTF